ncbi:hypothetical protein N7528_003320 [Penicillium herquei]|nr:hypothetical protein N7528_003320 [Penicillium herquei]
MEQRSSPAKSLPPRNTTTTPQLSCELCRKRKVKCDKLTPCTNCAASGTVCVPIYRTRLPRGRHATRPRHVSSPPPTSAPGEIDRIIQPSVPINENLQERIYRLEALIQGMNSHTRTPSTTSREQSVPLSDTSTFQTAPDPNTSPTLNNSIVSKRLMLQRPDQFWADLVDEIHGLREVVESSLAGGQEGPIPSSDSAKSKPPNDDGIQILGLGASNPSAPLRSISPLHNPVVTRQLCEVYLQQVDPVITILHRPSLNRWMVQGGTVSGFSAMFHANKADLLAESRVACETAIGRAGLLTTRDITVLQAFILYLVARRSEDRTPAVWTLIALAVRIGKGLGLYLDPETETFFDQQIRRRLWFTICLMDLQASFGQASEPLISVEESASTALPQHINDSDFDPTTAAHSDQNREGLTDTTFALVTYHAQRTGRLLNFVQHDRKIDGGGSNPHILYSRWPQQQARDFEEEALRLLHFCDPGTSAYAWFTWHGTQSLIATARLAAARPLQWHGQAPPPRREGNTELLRLCLPVLEKAQLMHTDPRAEGFRWYVTIPWHALAMALAECYVSNDTALVRYAWPLVESSYLQYEATLGQSLDGPFGQLMRRMREKLAVPASLPPSSLPRTTWSPATPPTFSGLPRLQISHDDRHASGCSWPVPTGSTPPADLPSLLPVSTWEALSLPSLDNPSLFGVPPMTTAAVADGMDPGAEIMLEELFSGIPFNDIAGPDMFFFDMNWGS